MSFLNFYLSVKSFFCLNFLILILLYVGFLLDNVFPWAVWICYPTALWPPLFMLRQQLLILLGILCKRHIIFLFQFSRFPYCWFSAFYYHVSVYESLWIYPTWTSLSFLDMCVTILKINFMDWDIGIDIYTLLILRIK